MREHSAGLPFHLLREQVGEVVHQLRVLRQNPLDLRSCAVHLCRTRAPFDPQLLGLFLLIAVELVTVRLPQPGGCRPVRLPQLLAIGLYLGHTWISSFGSDFTTGVPVVLSKYST